MKPKQNFQTTEQTYHDIEQQCPRSPGVPALTRGCPGATWTSAAPLTPALLLLLSPLILDSHPGGYRDSPPGDQIYCPCPWRLRLAFLPSPSLSLTLLCQWVSGPRNGPGSPHPSPATVYISSASSIASANTAQKDADPRVLVPWTRAQLQDTHTPLSEVPAPSETHPLRSWKLDRERKAVCRLAREKRTQRLPTREFSIKLLMKRS